MLKESLEENNLVGYKQSIRLIHFWFAFGWLVGLFFGIFVWFCLFVYFSYTFVLISKLKLIIVCQNRHSV